MTGYYTVIPELAQTIIQSHGLCIRRLIDANRSMKKKDREESLTLLSHELFELGNHLRAAFPHPLTNEDKPLTNEDKP